MTYTESAALMVEPEFRGRVKVAALKFADYIMNEAGSVPAHNVRMKWAATCFAQPEQTAMQLQNPVVMDGQVQLDGPSITDVALQSSVESVINKMM